MSGKSHEKELKSGAGTEIGAYVFSPQTLELIDETGAMVHLRRQSAEVLAHLVRNRGKLVSRDDLIAAVWPDTFVTNDSLAQCITDIRRALQDRDHGLIQTLPKRGYKLASANTQAQRRRRLQPWMFAAALAVFLVAGFFLLRGSNPEFEPLDPAATALPLPEKPSIAVLAFDDLSQGADKGFLSDAISEEILNRLSRFPDFFVIARNSSFFYRDRAVPLRDIAARLGVRYILEGSQQKSGDRLRVTARLVDATAGNAIWVETYERAMTEMFDLQANITRTIAATLEQNINEAEYARVLKQPTQSLAAYDLVNRGRAERLTFTPAGNQAARALSEQALTLDPGYSEAYFSLAWVHINCFRWAGDWCGDQSHDEALERALTAAREAVARDPDSALAHWVLANATMQSDDLERALAAYDRAIALNPNSAGVLADSTEVLVYLGRMDEAVDRIRSAIRLNPHHPDWYLWTLAWAQYFADDFEGGLKSLEDMAQMPNLARRTQAALLMRLGRQEDARAAIATLLENAPDYTISRQRHSLQGKFHDPSASDRFLEDLRAAGLPE